MRPPAAPVAAVKLATPRPVCDQHTGTLRTPCQRRGRWKVGHKCLCLQHAEIALGRPLTDAERA